MYQCLKISHTYFSKTYFLVRNNSEGLTANTGTYGKNLYNTNDPDVAEDTFIVWHTGAEASSSYFYASGYIPIHESKEYTASYVHSRAFYDEDKVYISGEDGGSATFTAPEGARYARFSISNESEPTFQVEEGYTATAHYAFGLTDFDYYPLEIKPSATRDNLDFGLDIGFGDLGEVIPNEIDRVREFGGMSERPMVYYFIFSSADLSAPLDDANKLFIDDIVRNNKFSTLSARAPSVNVNRTGRVHSIERFPTLKGFL